MCSFVCCLLFTFSFLLQISKTNEMDSFSWWSHMYRQTYESVMRPKNQPKCGGHCSVCWSSAVFSLSLFLFVSFSFAVRSLRLSLFLILQNVLCKKITIFLISFNFVHSISVLFGPFRFFFSSHSFSI